MATFLTDMMEKGYTQDKVFSVLFESEREKKRREMLARLTKTVDAHRLRKMRELLAIEKLATFRRMNVFDRDMDREYDWRSFPPTPESFNEWGERDTTIPSPGKSPKQPLPGIGLHDPLHGRQACPEFNSSYHGVVQICPR